MNISTRFHQIVLVAVALAPLGRAQAAPDKVVVFLAMPGAGKSTVAHAMAVRAGNAPIWSSGDVIRAAVAAKFGAYTIENDQAMRAEFGKTPGKVGQLVAAAVTQAQGPLGIVEGFRTPEDLTEFKKAFPDVKIVAIQVGAQRRYGRMLGRGRAGEDTVQVLRERDASELKLGVGRAMRLADLRIRPGDGPPALERSVEQLMKKLAIPSPAAAAR